MCCGVEPPRRAAELTGRQADAEPKAQRRSNRSSTDRSPELSERSVFAAQHYRSRRCHILPTARAECGSCTPSAGVRSTKTKIRDRDEGACSREDTRALVLPYLLLPLSHLAPRPLVNEPRAGSSPNEPCAMRAHVTLLLLCRAALRSVLLLGVPYLCRVPGASPHCPPCAVNRESSTGMAPPCSYRACHGTTSHAAASRVCCGLCLRELKHSNRIPGRRSRPALFGIRIKTHSSTQPHTTRPTATICDPWLHIITILVITLLA
jgi:hypothetical protein